MMVLHLSLEVLALVSQSSTQIQMVQRIVLTCAQLIQAKQSPVFVAAAFLIQTLMVMESQTALMVVLPTGPKLLSERVAVACQIPTAMVMVFQTVLTNVQMMLAKQLLEHAAVAFLTATRMQMDLQIALTCAHMTQESRHQESAVVEYKIRIQMKMELLIALTVAQTVCLVQRQCFRLHLAVFM
jgi:hypothetical protein